MQAYDELAITGLWLIWQRSFIYLWKLTAGGYVVCQRPAEKRKRVGSSKQWAHGYSMDIHRLVIANPGKK